MRFQNLLRIQNFEKAFTIEKVLSVIFMFYFHCEPVAIFEIYQAGMFKVNSRNTRSMCEIYSKLIIKIAQLCHWRRPSVFIVNFNRFYTLFWCSYFWLRTGKCQLGSVYTLRHIFYSKWQESKILGNIPLCKPSLTVWSAVSTETLHFKPQIYQDVKQKNAQKNVLKIFSILRI